MNNFLLYGTSLLQFFITAFVILVGEWGDPKYTSYDNLSSEFLFLIIFSCINIPIHVLALTNSLEKLEGKKMPCVYKICSVISFPFYIFWDVLFILKNISLKKKNMILKYLILVFSHYTVLYLVLFCITAFIKSVFGF